MKFCLSKVKKVVFLHPEHEREFSSVGSEHLPYKQGVAGSNPTIPTKNQGVTNAVAPVFVYYTINHCTTIFRFNSTPSSSTQRRR